jgi:hypothetical protein
MIIWWAALLGAISVEVLGSYKTSSSTNPAHDILTSFSTSTNSERRSNAEYASNETPEKNERITLQAKLLTGDKQTQCAAPDIIGKCVFNTKVFRNKKYFFLIFQLVPNSFSNS